MRNPFAAWKPSGTWEEHASYSEGGTDYPTPYGTSVASPASGTLRYDDWKGTAGRRATLLLDTPAPRVAPRSTTVMLGGGREAEGPMVAIVFQHLSAAPVERWYAEGAADMVRTGASASGKDWGGDVHMHVHGLDAVGRRLDFTKFIGAAPAGGGTTPIQGDIMSGIIRDPATGALTTIDGTVYQHHTSMASYEADALTYGPYRQAASQAQYRAAIANTQVKLAYRLAAQNGTPASAVDEDAIAAKVEQKLADDIARLEAKIAAVNANIDDQPTTFTGTLA